MITFRSPSSRVTLLIEGHESVAFPDWEWLIFLCHNRGIVEEKLDTIRTPGQRRHAQFQREGRVLLAVEAGGRRVYRSDKWKLTG